MESPWEGLRTKHVPKMLASSDQVRRVTYDGEPVPVRGAVLVGVTEFDSPEITNLPTPLRDMQLVEERMRTYQVDHVVTLTSSAKDPSHLPRMLNIYRAIKEMRRRITPQGLLLVVISTHGFVEDDSLWLVPSDMDPHTRSNVMRCTDLVRLVSPNKGERGVLFVDYGSHYRQTVVSFPEANLEQRVPHPGIPLGFAFISSPPKLPSSFCAKLCLMFDELIERKLPICPNSILAIFMRHSEKWFGSRRDMVLMTDKDRATVGPSGKVQVFDWDKVSALDGNQVSYVISFSQAVPPVGVPLPDSQSMARLLRQTAPQVNVRQQPAAEEQRRFIVKLSGAPTHGPREDRLNYQQEVANFCEERGLPRVEVVRAWFGRLVCITSAASFEVVCRGFQAAGQLRSSTTEGRAPTIDYIGIVCRPEVTSSLRVHLQLDELCRKQLMDPNTGIFIEEVGQILSKKRGGSTDDDPNTPSVHRSQGAQWGGLAPPASPSEEGSPMLTRVSTQPWSQQHRPPPPPPPQQQPQQPTDLSLEIARLAEAVQQEREERISSTSALEAQVRALQNEQAAARARENEREREREARTELSADGVNSQELRNTLTRLQLAQDALNQKVLDLERHQRINARSVSPQRGGASIEITNEEWMAYQDELKLLQVQLRDVQNGMPGHQGRAQQQPPIPLPRPASEPRTRQPDSISRLDPSTMQKCLELASRQDTGDFERADHDRRLNQQLHQIRRCEDDIQSLQSQVAMLSQTPGHSVLSPRVVHVDTSTPSVEDVRMLRQRIERIEGMSHLDRDRNSQMQAKSNIEVKVEMLQHVVDKLLSGGTPASNSNNGMNDVRKLYNDMMLEDIDAQLQGRLPTTAYTSGSSIPYLPTGLRAAIQGMVSSMINNVKEQIEKWASGQLGYQREQLSALNSATAEQLLSLQQKLSNLEERGVLRPVEVTHTSRSQLDVTVDTQAQQLASNMTAIHSLEQSLQMVQNTLTSHSGRLQGVELSLDNHVTELQGSVSDIRSRVDAAMQRLGQTMLELDQKLMKDITDCCARATVLDQRLNHIDSRLSEDADRMHRTDDRLEQTTRQLQDRIDEQGQKLFDTERRVTASLEDKMSIMRQIAEVAEKGTLEIERRWHDSEQQLKSQLRSALQQHIDGLEEVLQGMRNDLKGMEDKMLLMESVVSDCRSQGALLEQKAGLTDKNVEALRSGFETYVHDGTVHIMQAQNEKMEELRLKLGQELDTFDGRIKGIELQRKAADEELATALEKIQVAVASQPSHDKVDRALAVLEETKIRPAMETAVKSYEMSREAQNLAPRLDHLAEQVHATARDNQAQVEAHRERSVEIGMLKDQMMVLRDQLQHAINAQGAQHPQQQVGGADTERRVMEMERKLLEVVHVREEATVLREQVKRLQDSMMAQPAPQASVPQAAAPQPPDLSGVNNRLDSLEERYNDLNNEVGELQTDLDKMNVGGGGDGQGDGLDLEDLKKLKAKLADLTKEVKALSGWKLGKDQESEILEKLNKEVMDMRKSLTIVQDFMDSMKEPD